MTLWQDVKVAARSLARSKGLSAAVVATLALGVGANAMLFSIVNAFLFRPLPVPHPEEVVVVASRARADGQLGSLSYPELHDLSASGPFAMLAGYNMSLPGFAADGRADRVVASYVTDRYFELLGLTPAAGRLPGRFDDLTQVVLGHSFWQSRFGGDPGVVGRAVAVNGQPFTVAGVAPADFRGTYALLDTDVFLALRAGTRTGDYSDPLEARRDARNLHVLARLRPGTDRAAAQAALGVFAGQQSSAYPQTSKDLRFEAVPESWARPEENNADQAPAVAAIFMGLVALVLFVACVNVANLLLVRASTRSPELAVRAALGADRVRLVRTLLTEGLLLAVIGGALGAVIGRAGASALASVPMGSLPLRLDVSFDWRVFAWVAAITLLAGLAPGLLPALQASRVDLVPALRGVARGAVGGRHRLRDALVVVQVGACAVLLVAAGLFVRSLGHSETLDLGFRPEGVVNVNLDVSRVGYDEARGRAFYAELLRRAQALPGVDSASLAYSVPMGYYSDYARTATAPGLLADQATRVGAQFIPVTPDYFRTLGIVVRQGRGLSAGDTATSARVAVVNEELARRLWPGEEAVGRSLFLDLAEGQPVQVVGLVPTGKYRQITEDPQPALYVPLEQSYRSLAFLHVRTSRPTAAMARALTEEVAALDSGLPVSDVGSMTESLAGPNGFFLLRAAAVLAGALGALGLLLSIVGVYGVVSYSAEQRARELGVRVALGATARDVITLVVRHGLGLAAAGLLAGTLAALALLQGLAGFLIGVTPHDPLTYGTVVLALAAAVAAASLAPALRAARSDPASVLRA